MVSRFRSAYISRFRIEAGNRKTDCITFARGWRRIRRIFSVSAGKKGQKRLSAIVRVVLFKIQTAARTGQHRSIRGTILDNLCKDIESFSKEPAFAGGGFTAKQRHVENMRKCFYVGSGVQQRHLGFSCALAGGQMVWQFSDIQLKYNGAASRRKRTANDEINKFRGDSPKRI